MNLTGQHFINGQWASSTDQPFYSLDPFTNQPIWQGNAANHAVVTDAVASAHNALKGWSGLSVEGRAHHLMQFATQVEKNRIELSKLISRETGKPLWESATEVGAVIGKIKLSIEAYKARTSEKITSYTDYQSCLRYKPHGVIAVLGAFNFPAHLSNGHIVPALLAGNTVVYKPSELTPAVGEFILRCWDESGLPAGVINGVQGAIQTGVDLLDSPIDGVFFTGSYQTGQRIHQQFSSRPEIILALEMGGNNPLVIDDIHDIPAAVYNTILSSFITAGQRCTCARRLLVADNTQGDHFITALIQASKALTIGHYLDTPEPFMGPVIGVQQARHYIDAQQQLINLGGAPLLKMSLMKQDSALLSPGIIDMTGVSNIPDKEIFAPFIQVYRYQQFEDALAIANNTRYGLSAGLFSSNAKHYQLFYDTIKAGLINWNRPTTGGASNLPFGGVGLSGNHRPSAYFAADYCAYPIANLEQSHLALPAEPLPGIHLG